MNKFMTFQEFLSAQSVQVPIAGFMVNLVLAALLGYLLSVVYIRWGRSLSNRRAFASTFVLLTVSTMVVISIVKSSLALSLGLVGALSIVRFRAAIKEPEELVYLFFAIAMGLGIGADQRVITVLAFVMVTLGVAVRHWTRKNEDHQNLYLSVSASGSDRIRLDQIMDSIRKHSRSVNLRRFDETPDQVEASFVVEFDHFKDLSECKRSLQESDGSVKITFLDNKGVMS